MTPHLSTSTYPSWALGYLDHQGTAPQLCLSKMYPTTTSFEDNPTRSQVPWGMWSDGSRAQVIWAYKRAMPNRNAATLHCSPSALPQHLPGWELVWSHTSGTQEQGRGCSFALPTPMTGFSRSPWSWIYSRKVKIYPRRNNVNISVEV